MKYDLVEINKLTPPGLWDLGVLASVIAMLRGALRAHAGHVSELLYARMILQYSESLRERTRDNLNMRIKAWILLCPARIARVRRVIGEGAIKRWRTNRLADYALSKYFGNWRRKWPDGFGGGLSGKNAEPKRYAAPKYRGNTRPYTWKLFALVKIVNVHSFLYGKRPPNAEEQDMRDAYYKLWGVDILADKIRAKWTQPRQARALKPIRFTPDELEVDGEETQSAQPVITMPVITMRGTPKRIEGAVQSETKTDEKPPSKKPP